MPHFGDGADDGLDVGDGRLALIERGARGEFQQHLHLTAVFGWDELRASTRSVDRLARNTRVAAAITFQGCSTAQPRTRW